MKKLVADLAEKAFYAIIDGLSLIGEYAGALLDIPRSILTEKCPARKGVSDE